jgi:LacI family transcriptional regulator
MVVTIRDVARLAGVSIATVSQALSGNRPVSAATRAQVLEAAKTLGYRPNRVAVSMVTRKTRTLAIIVPDIANPFFAALVKAVEGSAVERGYATVACSSDGNGDLEERYLELLTDNHYDALLYVGDHPRLSPRLTELADQGTAVVLIDRVPDDLAHVFPTIAADNAAGGALAATHLAELGHVEIGVVAGPRGLSTSTVRLRGFRAVLRKNGIVLGAEAVYHASDFTLDSGVKAVQRVLARYPAITALFCENDLIALGAIRVARQNGLEIPADLSIVGFDDIFVSSLVTPALTTIRQPITELGAVAVDIAVQLSEDRESTHASVVLPVELVCRESSAPAKRSSRAAQTGRTDS